MAKVSYYSLPPISMLFAQISMFLRKGLTENSNIDVAGGTSVLKILYKACCSMRITLPGYCIHSAYTVRCSRHIDRFEFYLKRNLSGKT